MKRLLITTLLALILPILATSFAYAKKEDPKARIVRLQKEEQALNKVLKSFASQRSEAASGLRRSEQQLANYARQARKLQAQINNSQDKLEQLKKHQKALFLQRKKEQKVLALLLVDRYLSGNSSWLELLLNQQDPNLTSRNLTYYQYFYQSQEKIITNYRQILMALEANEAQQKASRQSLLQQQNLLSTKQAQVNNEQKKRQQTLAQLNKTIKTKQQHLGHIQAQRKELTKIVAALEKAQAEAKSLSTTAIGVPIYQAKGKLTWPVKGRLAIYYNNAKANSLASEGILITAAQGTPVQATYHGQVVFSNWLRGYGLVIIIDHGSGYLSLYAHNQTLLKHSGDWVQAGEIIARVGNSGGQSKPALYFQLRKKGNPFNPLPWLGKRPT